MTNNNFNCGLSRHFRELDTRLAGATDGFTFTPAHFPLIPPILVSDAISARKNYKYVNDCYRLDVVHFRAEPETYRYLGLLILNVVFSRELREANLKLEDANSDVRLIKIRYDGSTPRGVYEYLTQPLSFRYRPSELDEYPWNSVQPSNRQFPEFHLTYSGSEPEKHWDSRDVIEGFGSDEAAVMVATLFLDLGRSNNQQNFVRLETPIGRGGVSKLSPEIQLHLPNSETWPFG